MPARNKIDPLKLCELLEEGKSRTDIAKFFNCTPQAVSKAIKNMDKTLTVQTLTARAPELADRKMNLTKDLEMVHSDLLELHKELKVSRGRVKKEEKAEYEVRIARIVDRIHKSLNLATYIMSTLYNVEHATRFMEILIEEVGQVDQETKKRILQRLKASRTLRDALKFPRT